MNTPLIVNAEELRSLIKFEDLIEPVSRAFQEFSAGLAENHIITMFPARTTEMGDVYVKTGSIKGHPVFIVKVSPWFAINVERQIPQGGFIAVFDAETGHTRAILNEEHYLSDIRTAAAGALAARVLAPQKIKTVAVIGTGVQAFWQLQALAFEREFIELLIWGRDLEKVENLAKRLETKLPGVTIQVASTIESAVHAADVVITTTQSREPLIKGEWLRPGQHMTAIGADDQTKCELDVETLKRANRLIVDSREANLAHGDIHRWFKRNELKATNIHGEIGEVLSEKIAGRSSADEITVAKFVGIGVQDLAAAETSLEKLEKNR